MRNKQGIHEEKEYRNSQRVYFGQRTCRIDGTRLLSFERVCRRLLYRPVPYIRLDWFYPGMETGTGQKKREPLVGYGIAFAGAGGAFVVPETADSSYE